MDEQPGDPEDRPDEEGVLTPDELDIESAEEVDRIGDNRYVVSTDSSEDTAPDEPLPPRDDAPSSTGGGPEPRHDHPSDRGGTTPDPPDRADRGPPTSDVGGPTPLGALPQRYAIDLRVKTDTGVDGTRIASDDVVVTFERLLRWYATQLDGDTPAEEVLDILLAECSFQD